MVFEAAAVTRWSEATTIHGVRYAFDARAAYWQRLLWVAVSLAAATLALYMSAQIFMDWKEQASANAAAASSAMDLS